MLKLWAKARKWTVAIPDSEVLVSTRGFLVDDKNKIDHLENIGRAFVAGYNAAVASYDLNALHGDLESCPPAMRGFAYEGASMGLVIADFLTPFDARSKIFLSTFGVPHTYLVHVGYGWALARLPIPTLRAIRKLNDPLRWLAMDGYGFHQGYFSWRRYILTPSVPTRPDGYAAKVFDQGLGRSLWFVCGAEPRKIASSISRFDPQRTPDLWAGVGLAAAYAGGASRSELEEVRAFAGDLLPHTAQGAAFAAEARMRAGNPTQDAELACRIFCEMSLENAARIAREALPTEQASDGEELYEVWRRHIRQNFSDIAAGAAV